MSEMVSYYSDVSQGGKKDIFLRFISNNMMLLSVADGTKFCIISVLVLSLGVFEWTGFHQEGGY